MSKKFIWKLDKIYPVITGNQDFRMTTAAWKDFLLNRYDEFFYNGEHWKATAKSLGAGIYSVTAKRS